MGNPLPLPHKGHAKTEPAELYEVTNWVMQALRRERATGTGEFLTPVMKDFRGVNFIADAFIADDIPDDDLRMSLILRLHSGQEYRISIEEK